MHVHHGSAFPRLRRLWKLFLSRRLIDEGFFFRALLALAPPLVWGRPARVTGRGSAGMGGKGGISKGTVSGWQQGQAGAGVWGRAHISGAEPSEDSIRKIGDRQPGRSHMGGDLSDAALPGSLTANRGLCEPGRSHMGGGAWASGAGKSRPRRDQRDFGGGGGGGGDGGSWCCSILVLLVGGGCWSRWC